MNPYALIDRIIVDTDDGQHVAELCDGALNEQGEYIVKCVNAHDELVAALRELKNYVLDENAASTPLGEAAARAREVLRKLAMVDVVKGDQP
jgi:hypothetical protein